MWQLLAIQYRQQKWPWLVWSSPSTGNDSCLSNKDIKMKPCNKCHEGDMLNAEIFPSLPDEPWQLPWWGKRWVDFLRMHRSWLEDGKGKHSVQREGCVQRPVAEGIKVRSRVKEGWYDWPGESEMQSTEGESRGSARTRSPWRNAILIFRAMGSHARMQGLASENSMTAFVFAKTVVWRKDQRGAWTGRRRQEVRTCTLYPEQESGCVVSGSGSRNEEKKLAWLQGGGGDEYLDDLLEINRIFHELHDQDEGEGTARLQMEQLDRWRNQETESDWASYLKICGSVLKWSLLLDTCFHSSQNNYWTLTLCMCTC